MLNVQVLPGNVLVHFFQEKNIVLLFYTYTYVQESTKQLTMRQLPIVASFHLKRFEHSSR